MIAWLSPISIGLLLAPAAVLIIDPNPFIGSSIPLFEFCWVQLPIDHFGSRVTTLPANSPQISFVQFYGYALHASSVIITIDMCC